MNAQEKMIKKLRSEIANEFEVADGVTCDDFTLNYFLDDDIGCPVGYVLDQLGLFKESGKVRASNTMLEITKTSSELDRVENLEALGDWLSDKIPSMTEADGTEAYDIEDAKITLAILRQFDRILICWQGIAFVKKADANKAKKIAINVTMTHRHPELELPLPEWAIKALEAGWKKPEGWTP